MPVAFELISGLISIFAYALVVFTGYKVWQISNDVAELNEVVKDIRRNTDSQVPVSQPTSPEALVRAVHAASYSEIVDGATHSEQPR
jgi:hypothetical protein